MKKILVVDRERLILEGISEGVLEITSDGIIVYANPFALSLIRIPEEELLGSYFIELFAGDDRQRVSKLMKAKGKRPKGITGDSPVDLKGHQLTLNILPLDGDRFTKIIVVNDVTKRKRLEEELRASEARLRDLIGKNSDAILIVDREGIVRFANPAAGTLFGKRSEEFTGDPFGFPITASETSELDLVGRDKGAIVVEMRVEDTEWEGERVYLLSIRDITQRKRIEEGLRKANQSILEQQKMVIEEERLKVLLQMAGATAHEMNQPLMSLLGNIDLMRANGDDPEKLTRRLREIETAGKRISGIVKKTQDISHYETKPYIEGISIVDLDQEIKILIVSDSDDDFETVGGVLKDMDQISMTRARTIAKALEILGQDRIDLVLLGYLLPDGNGLDFLRIMDEKGIETPVIVIADQGNEMIASRVIQAGASDYLTREMVSEKSLSRSIAGSLEKSRLKRDIRLAQEKMAEMATKDELTRLFNRRYFMEAFEREMARAKRHKTGLALCMMDLDHFKEINDTYGHSAGDMVLSTIGNMLTEWARQSDIPCRYGGEEFAVILPDTGVEGGMAACERLREMVAGHCFKYEASQFKITASIGIARYGGSMDQSPAELIDKIDQALYRAKREGRNRVVGF
ncbi:MAG: diguanylate cyclase [Desulfobacteraceae bacterium]|nr:diguanylate cyclase [Desulfobacteraceae bacterium]